MRDPVTSSLEGAIFPLNARLGKIGAPHVQTMQGMGVVGREMDKGNSVWSPDGCEGSTWGVEGQGNR